MDKRKEKDLAKRKKRREPKDRSDCVFCSLFDKEAEKLLYEDDKCFAFYDKRRKSMTEHVLVCSKEHIQDADCLTVDHIDLLLALQNACQKLLRKLTPDQQYRFGYHEPPHNSIGHLHLHGITLPITEKYLNDVVYGKGMTSTSDLIHKIKKRALPQPKQKSIKDFFKSKEKSPSQNTSVNEDSKQQETDN